MEMLELSGIDNPDILTEIGVKPKIDLHSRSPLTPRRSGLSAELLKLWKGRIGTIDGCFYSSQRQKSVT